MNSSSSEEVKVTTWTTSQVVFATLFVVCVFLIFWLLYSLRVVLFLFFVAIVIVLSLYWSADQFRFERLGLSLLPEEHHPKALYVWRSVEAGVGEYLRSQIIQSVVAGLLLWLGHSVLGIRYPVLLALWGAIVRLIPWFGAVIAVLPALFLGIGISSTVGILRDILNSNICGMFRPFAWLMYEYMDFFTCKTGVLQGLIGEIGIFLCFE